MNETEVDPQMAAIKARSMALRIEQKGGQLDGMLDALDAILILKDAAEAIDSLRRQLLVAERALDDTYEFIAKRHNDYCAKVKGL